MKSLAELEAIRDRMRSQIDNRDVLKDGDTVVRVGMATCGIAAGAREVMSAFLKEISRRGVKNVKVLQTGCAGICRMEPMVEVTKGGETVTYVKINPDKVARIVSEHIVNGNVCTQFVVGTEE